jgi:hypothetical protein
MPPWLNSSMQLLNDLPALNTSALGAPWRGPSPGALAVARGRRPHHPVVIVPGFISSAGLYKCVVFYYKFFLLAAYLRVQVESSLPTA